MSFISRVDAHLLLSSISLFIATFWPFKEQFTILCIRTIYKHVDDGYAL